MNTKASVDCLTNLKKEYVITPDDKANNNIAIICKNFYIKNILEETGLWNNSNSSTYEEEVHLNKDDILQ